MIGDGIFLRTGPGLTVLLETPYGSEAILQEALALYPQVIAGRTTSGTDSALLLVSREMGIHNREAAGQAFSLDHLFLDAEGVPVLVEVKRSSDTRIRREVIGQMLDYAANAKFWQIEQFRSAIDARATLEGTTSDELVSQLSPDTTPEEFWTRVADNLGAGRIRMLFVADTLPASLRRIIEFLNEQMAPAEVLGVEVPQYTGGDHTVYAPRVVGQTTTAVAAKSAGCRAWDRESFLEAAASRGSESEVELMKRLIRHCDECGVRLSWGRGATPGVSGWYAVGGRPTSVWVLNANRGTSSARAYLTFYLGDIARTFGTARMEMAASALSAIPQLAQKIADARASGWNKWPSVYLQDVASQPERVASVTAAIDQLRDPATPSGVPSVVT